MTPISSLHIYTNKARIPHYEFTKKTPIRKRNCKIKKIAVWKAYNNYEKEENKKRKENKGMIYLFENESSKWITQGEDKKAFLNDHARK